MRPRRARGPVLPLIAGVLRATAAHEHASGAVIAADEVSWTQRVVDSPHPVFTAFFSSAHNSMPHEFDGELDALAKTYRGMADVVKVDCAPDVTMRKLCQASESVPKLPHMRVYAAAKQQSPYTKEWYKEHKVHEGSPLAKDMGMALQAQMPDTHIVRVPSMEAWRTVGRDSGLPQVLVFSRKQDPSLLLRAMAARFVKRLDFVLITSGVGELMEQFGITTAPALVVRKMSGETEVFTGKLEAPSLSEFLRRFAQDGEQADANRKSTDGETPPVFSQTQKFQNVTLAALPQLLNSEEDVWLLAFTLASTAATQQEECQSTLRHFANLTQEVGDMVRVGLVTLSDEELGDVHAKAGVPRAELERCTVALRVKAFGAKASASELAALPSKVDSKTALQHIYSILPDLTVHITGETLPAFMGMQPGGLSPLTPKVILATAKLEAPPLFKLLAFSFRSRGLAFGWFSSELDPEVAQQIPTARRPAMLVAFVDPESPADDQGRVPLQMEPYTMPLKHGPMAAFLESVAQRLGQSEDKGARGEDDTERYSGSTKSGSAIVQSDTDAAFASQCMDLGGVCLVGLLDPDSSSHEADIAALQALQSVRRGQPIHFTWIDAPRQRTFLTAFVFESAPLPSAIILAPRKMRFSQLQGAFTQENLSRFVDKVLGGQIATIPLKELPGLVLGGEALASAEPAIPVEEEFDLSDIMGTAVEESGDDRDERLAKAQAEAKREAKRLQAEAAEKTAAAEKDARRAAQKAKRKREAAKAAQREEL